MQHKPNQILVTGGAGFIGSHFVLSALKKYPAGEIINLDKLTYAACLDNLKTICQTPRYHFVQGDIGDGDLVASLLQRYNIDTIVHFAAESHVDNSIVKPLDFIKTNIEGTGILLHAAKKYWQAKGNFHSCRFHHISTDELYGTLSVDDQPFTESSPYLPNSPYAASKAGAAHLVRSFYQTYQMPVTLSHACNNYGPHQHQEKLIPKVIASCLKKEPITVYGSGEQIRDWMYVGHHCQLIHKVIEEGTHGTDYNLGGGNEWQNLALINTICQQMNTLVPTKTPYQALITHTTDRPGHDFRYALSSKYPITQFNHKAIFKECLQHTIKWYLNMMV